MMARYRRYPPFDLDLQNTIRLIKIPTHEGVARLGSFRIALWKLYNDDGSTCSKRAGNRNGVANFKGVLRVSMD